MKTTKEHLYTHCQQWVDEKINLAKNEIEAVQASANEETKSSAGDKYETGRAMAQLEVEKNNTQLAAANKMKQMLNAFSPDTHSLSVIPGSLVHTQAGWFYISISAGRVDTNGKPYICLSLASPLGSKMSGLLKGDSFQFNKRDYRIMEVY